MTEVAGISELTGMTALRARLTPLVAALYPETDRTDAVVADLIALAERYADLAARVSPAIDERTAYLITYGDSIIRRGQPPLQTLAQILAERVGDAVSDVHVLPMFPWTSDDGFAVVDYREINPSLGDWADIAALGEAHDLMFDFVANHASASSTWFRGWLAGEERYDGYFFSPPADFDTSQVVRPRTTPLLHPYRRADGSRVSAWTTFGPDQVDVNVATPAVLLDLTDVLLGYLRRGATTIRLDAIGFLWKDSGTTCFHRPGTHAVIKIWRALVDELAPGVRLLTETNVPHADNITYLGDGRDEAHMVYQFALPPLVLHSFVSGSAQRLTDWAAALEEVGPDATWFNFLASHDGIGMRPSEGLLSEPEREALVERALAHGGRVSLATAPDGSSSVYELNVSFLDALLPPEQVHDDARVVARALAAHVVLLSMIGVPAIYVHSLVGSSHDREGMERTGINRRINRRVLDADVLEAELESSPRRRGIFEGLRRLLAIRSGVPAFSPYAPQEVLELGPEVFAVRRGVRGDGSVLAIVNVSGAEVDLPDVGGRDLISGRHVAGLSLAADDCVWLEEERYDEQSPGGGVHRAARGEARDAGAGAARLG